MQATGLPFRLFAVRRPAGGQDRHEVWELIMKILAIAMILLASAPQAGKTQREGNASMVYETLGLLQESVGQGNSYIIREADLNAFIRVELSRQAPPAIQELGVDLGAGQFTTQLKVNMDDLDLSSQGTAASLLGSLLSGVQELIVVGAVDTDKGQGSYSTEQASLNGVALPATIVDMLLSAIGSRLEPPFDPTQPFRLPNGIQSIDVREGSVELTN